jgi:hypothetical protein
MGRKNFDMKKCKKNSTTQKEKEFSLGLSMENMNFFNLHIFRASTGKNFNIKKCFISEGSEGGDWGDCDCDDVRRESLTVFELSVGSLKVKSRWKWVGEGTQLRMEKVFQPRMQKSVPASVATMITKTHKPKTKKTFTFISLKHSTLYFPSVTLHQPLILHIKPPKTSPSSSSLKPHSKLVKT